MPHRIHGISLHMHKTLEKIIIVYGIHCAPCHETTVPVPLPQGTVGQILQTPICTKCKEIGSCCIQITY